MPSKAQKTISGIFIVALILGLALTGEAGKDVPKNRAEITLTNGQKVILENLKAIYPAGNWVNVPAGTFPGLHYRYARTEINDWDKDWISKYIPFSEMAAIDFHYVLDGDRTEDFIIISKKDGSTISFKRFGGFQPQMKFVIEKIKPSLDAENLNVYRWSFSTFEKDRKERVVWKIVGRGKNEKGELKERGFLWGSEIKKIDFMK